MRTKLCIKIALAQKKCQNPDKVIHKRVYILKSKVEDFRITYSSMFRTQI